LDQNAAWLRNHYIGYPRCFDALRDVRKNRGEVDLDLMIDTW